MGVKECDRNCCDEIMCRNMIAGHYICDDCLDEFKTIAPGGTLSEKEWHRLFIEFMKSEKTPGSLKKRMSLDDFLNGKY